MSTILDSLDALPADLSRRITILSDDESRALRERVTHAFTDGTAVRTDALVHDAQVTCEDSWKLIEDFETANPVVLFTNLRDGDSMFEVPSIRDVLAVLGQLRRFDFYLVDRACTFLFAFDEYDTLFGCGTAASYVAKL